MKINYGLWWDETTSAGQVKRHSQNFSIEHDMYWDKEESHQEFRKIILEKHPGTHIIGYAPAENEEEQK